MPSLPPLSSRRFKGLPGEKLVLLASAVFGQRPVVRDHSAGGAWRDLRSDHLWRVTVPLGTLSGLWTDS